MSARFNIAVCSGKGGVGKSTVALNLACALAARGERTGLLDADLYGPDIPRMLGLARSREATHLDLWRADDRSMEPIVEHGVKVMSAGFMVAEGQSISLEGMLVEPLLVRMTRGVKWGDLDYLIVDLPPGTADLQQQLMRRLDLAGAILVVTPQDVAHLDARKVLDLCKRSNVRVLGGIENMSGLVCPCCGERVDVFPRVAHERSIWAQGVERLAEIPLDPQVARWGDEGVPVVRAAPASEEAVAFEQLAGIVASTVAR